MPSPIKDYHALYQNMVSLTPSLSNERRDEHESVR